ncbi:MAG: AAA family ATPase [Lachnospiraceae bacterium]|nr:AAA family ATPase [Lachnospiraceae bacterium]
MKLSKIRFRNFRNFEDFQITLGRKVTVFIGRNGMGKTNIIDGLVQSLSFIFSKQRGNEQYEFIRSTDQSVKSFRSVDPLYEDNNYNYPISLDVDGEIETGNASIPLTWSFEQESKKSGLKDSKFRDAYHKFWGHYNLFEEKPLLAFFSDGFPHKDTNISSGMKDKLKTGNPLPAGDGYYQWDKEQSCVNIWKKYFVQQWINNRLNPDPVKEAFVNAISGKLHDFSSSITDMTTIDNSVSGLSVDYRDDEATLLVELSNGTKKPFDSLPAGYERIYSMVLDLASRSYLLNGNTNPEGIVFIDEIDLHLHPTLEADVLSCFIKSFPRVQFIVSTHSPMVISNFNQADGVAGDCKLINLLKNEDEYYCKTIENIYGLDYNSSLINIMGTRQQQKFTDELAEAYLYWKEKDQSKAGKIAELLLQKYDRNSSLIQALNL